MKLLKGYKTRIVLFVLAPCVAIGQDQDSPFSRDGADAAPEVAVDAAPPQPEDVGNTFGKTVESDETEQDNESRRNIFEGNANGDNDAMALSDEDTISVDFPNEEIRTVLRNVADLYMLNLVIPQELRGTTSVKLRDVTWSQIFSVILDPVGYTYTEEGNIIQVVSKETLNFEPPVTEIFMLNYADAGQIASTLSSMVDASKGGRIQVDSRTNSIIVSERQSSMPSIRGVIDRLDKPTLQVMIETRFVEITTINAEETGLDWERLLLDYEAKLAGSTVLDGPSKSYLQLKSQLDGITRTDRQTSAVFSVDEISLVFSALRQRDDIELISNPTVVTLNNQEANIKITKEYPIPNYTYNEERGTFEISGFEYKDIGVLLTVKPSVNNEGLITLKVEPEVSYLAGEITFGSGASAVTIPVADTRLTKTQLALKDGYTMGLGGLIRTENTTKETKVPLLGNIPLIGGAFRHNRMDKQKHNLLIFITAKILPSENADFEDVFEQSRLEEVGLNVENVRNR